VHTCAFEAGGDGDFASGFDDATGGAKAERLEVRVTHALQVPVQVLKTFSGLFGRDGAMSDGAQQIGELASVEFVMASLGPLARLGESAP
jgi:hypothetical protein